MNINTRSLSCTLLILLGSASPMVQAAALTQPVMAAERAALFPPVQMIELGKTVAESTCANCHGMSGVSADDSLPNLAGQRSVYLYRVLKAYQEAGRESESMQHVSRFLNDEAMLSVSAYYASRSPSAKAYVSGATAESGLLADNPFTGIQDVIDKCTKCHGETGNSTASGMPNLTAQDPEYFAASMAAYVDGNRSHRMMKKLVKSIEPTTVGEMGVYYAVQEPVRTETQGEGDADAGRQLAEECGACHGANGNAGGEKMPTLAGQDARYFIKAMDAYKGRKRQHKSMFDAAEELSDEDISNLATFYAAQEPVKRNVRMPLKTTEWIARCERCHGADGNSTDPRFPMLAGQNETYLRKVMQSYTDGERSKSVMHAMSAPLSKTDIERIVSYYASQEPRPVVYIQLPCEENADQ